MPIVHLVPPLNLVVVPARTLHELTLHMRDLRREKRQLLGQLVREREETYAELATARNHNITLINEAADLSEEIKDLRAEVRDLKAQVQSRGELNSGQQITPATLYSTILMPMVNSIHPMPCVSDS